MMPEYFFTAVHQVAKQLDTRSGRTIVGNKFVRNVVWRLGLGLCSERSGLLAAINKDVAITHAGIELEFLSRRDRATQRSLDCSDQILAFLIANVPRREVAH